MKVCHIYPVAAGTGYQWKWRCTEGKRKSVSDHSFELFYDCVEDARSHGGQVDLKHVHREIAEGTHSSAHAPAAARQ